MAARRLGREEKPMRKRIVLEEKKSITEYYRDYGAGNGALVTTREWEERGCAGSLFPGGCPTRCLSGSRGGVIGHATLAIAQGDVHEDISQGGLEADHERFGVFAGFVALFRC